MPADIVSGAVFAVLFLGAVAGLLYLMGRLDQPDRSRQYPGHVPPQRAGATGRAAKQQRSTPRR